MYIYIYIYICICISTPFLICLSVLNCKVTPIGTSYMGDISKTVSGKTCQAWTSQNPHKHKFTNAFFFSDENIADAANKCRNPDGRKGGPWCYTTDPSTPCEYCDIPNCGK